MSFKKRVNSVDLVAEDALSLIRYPSILINEVIAVPRVDL
jgi:hypothetical protein